MNADSIRQRDSLPNAVRPFPEDNRTVAVGGTVHIANGCDVDDGLITRVRLPRRLLPLIQVVEYLRAVLYGGVGWTRLNAVPIGSGAFGVFDRETLGERGG